MASTPKILFDGGVSDVLFTDRREFYPASEVFEYWKNQSQFLTFINMVSNSRTDDPLYKLFEDEPTYVRQYFLINGATDTIAANGTESASIAIDGLVNLTKSAVADESLIGLLLEVFSSAHVKKGQMFVSSYVSSTNVKFKTTKSVAIVLADNDICRVIGTVRGEKSVAGEGYYNELKTVWNSTHYYSLPVEITGKLYKEVKLRGYSDELARLREKKFKEAKQQIQNMFLKSSSTVGTNFVNSNSVTDTFSEASLRTITDGNGNTSAVRTTYGFIPILEDYGIIWAGAGAINDDTNIFQVPTSSLDFDLLSDITKVVFDKRETKTIPGFCGTGFVNEMAKALKTDKFGMLGKVEISGQKTNSIGWDCREFYTPNGTIQLVETKGLIDEYDNWCCLPNDQAIGIREYEPWQYIADIKKDNNYNGIKDVINYDAGLQLNLLKTHHIIQLF